MTRAAALLTAACLLALQGCVAAVLPLAAGATIGKARMAKNEKRPNPEPSQQAATLVQLDLKELPPPDFVAEAVSRTVDDFSSYALAAARGDDGRQSALLADSAQLQPERRPCNGLPPAVFIDLDPGRAAFDPLAPGRPDPALAAALAALRADDIAVVWFSRLGENFADPVRGALRDSGLDPKGEDQIVLMRDIQERKQTRRLELARQLCPVALLGDQRADFDELYLYLKRPEGAIALEQMIGNGWFLADPFAPRSQIAEGNQTP